MTDWIAIYKALGVIISSDPAAILSGQVLPCPDCGKDKPLEFYNACQRTILTPDNLGICRLCIFNRFHKPNVTSREQALGLLCCDCPECIEYRKRRRPQ